MPNASKKIPAGWIAGGLLAAVVLLGLILWLGRPARTFVPDGQTTGVDRLDQSVLELLEEICDPAASLEDNMGAVYDWICAEIKYRPGTADSSGGFTVQLRDQLAEETLNQRKGNCDGEAALTAVLLQRLGCETMVVTGQFLREDGQWVDHAWTAAAMRDGNVYYFDPLYGAAFADNPRDYFMRDSEKMKETHRSELMQE